MKSYKQYVEEHKSDLCITYAVYALIAFLVANYFTGDSLFALAVGYFTTK